MTADIVLTTDYDTIPSAAHFFTAGSHLLELLDDLSETPNVDWTISELRLASAVSGLTARGGERSDGVRAARIAVQGLTQIRAGQGLPETWTPTALTHAKELVRRSGDRARLTNHDNVVFLDQRLRDNLEAVTPWVREYYGSVRGQLTGVNVTRGNRASVKPQEGGRVVHVGFPSQLAERMRDGLLEFVEIEGTVKQNDEGRVYYVGAESVSVVVEPTLSWSQMLGYLPEITGGLTTTQYLDGIRGEE